jgi:ribulose-5-phosphate 4-epimerase/fuculose-1-phosphate aldolase
MEKYRGVKFEMVEEQFPIDKKDRLKFLAVDKVLKKFLKTKKNEGNLSIKTKNGFLIKRAGGQMTKLTKNDVILVRKISGRKVFCSGGMPSSESRMHYEIYKNTPAAKIILHFHRDELLGKLPLARVGPFSYGSTALAKAAGRVSKKYSLFEILRHGFVIVGKSKNEIFEVLKTIC